MNQRERFFKVLTGQPVDHAPFFPDISTWYENTRKDFGTEELFLPGAYIPDNHPFHKRPSRLQGKQANFTCLDFYREYDWGLPVHIYDWLIPKYTGVEVKERREGKMKRISYETESGNLYRTYVRDHDGSWAPKDTLIKDWKKDVPILKYLISHTAYQADYSTAEAFLQETEGFGVCDLVIWRSPFGKLIHEYLGFENTIYALMDNGDEVRNLLDFTAEYDLKTIELAAAAPVKLVIISDHADENLISPAYYREFCMPFYQRACELLHKKEKFVSTHLDGNIKSFLGFLGKTGFDLLDGCTPYPMFNYTVEELASAPNRPACYLGIPSALFVDGTSGDDIRAFALRIARTFNQQVIVNVGDILPPGSDIEEVIAAGEVLLRCKGQP
jgi:hypothetical protein